MQFITPDNAPLYVAKKRHGLEENDGARKKQRRGRGLLKLIPFTNWPACVRRLNKRWIWKVKCKVGKEGRLENVMPLVRVIRQQRWQLKWARLSSWCEDNSQMKCCFQ